MNEKIYLSAEFRKQLEDRLKELNTEIIPDAVEKLKTAREFGDLSENAEYVTAKDRLARLTAEKEDIETKLKFAVELNTSEKSSDAVTLGSKVVVYNEAFKKEFTYQIVGTAEADIYANKISNESSLGKAMLGKRKGEECSYVAPNGRTYSVKVVDIIL